MRNEDFYKPKSLPPYPQMILRAIAALDEPNGSNKSSISKYIESTYGEVPSGHSAQLTDHLVRMRDSGELVFWKNNYTKADPNAPPRRGRGRPPKHNGLTSPQSGLDSGSARPRGRPPKDPNASPKVKSPSSLGRGRPRKMARPAGGLDVGSAEEEEEPRGLLSKDLSASPNVGKPRGRPRKMVEEEEVGPAEKMRGRGRPPKEKARYNNEVSVQ